VAKSRAQRKAEARRRQAERARKGQDPAADESRAQHDTQVGESADVTEAELAEHGADLDGLRGRPEEGDGAGIEAPAPSRADVGRPAAAEAEPADKISRRARRQAEREQRQKAKESERRRAPKDAPVERQRGGVSGFIASCWAELKRVQWPDRETLIQATAITVIFIAVMAAYLGVLDAVFNWLVQRIL
jgi:preprotein translocase SecE subunit